MRYPKPETQTSPVTQERRQAKTISSPQNTPTTGRIATQGAYVRSTGSKHKAIHVVIDVRTES